MKNVTVLWISLLLTLTLLVLACGENKPYVIHFVNYRGHTDVDKGFEKYLKERKVNYRIIYHDAGLDAKKIPEIVSVIRAEQKTDLIVTWGTTVALGVFGQYDSPPQDLRYIKDRKGVFTLVTDPVASKIISADPSPRLITGAWHVAPIDSQFGAMMVYRPGKKIGMLFTPTEVNAVTTARLLSSIAASFNVEVIAIPLEVTDGKVVPANVIASLREMKKQGAEWLYFGPDSYLATITEDLVMPEAHKLGLATFAATDQTMKAGAAFGLIAPYIEIGEMAGAQAYEILVNKTEPANIPVTAVRRFQHQLNSKAVRELNITVQPSLIKDIIDVAPK